MACMIIGSPQTWCSENTAWTTSSTCPSTVVFVDNALSHTFGTAEALIEALRSFLRATGAADFSNHNET